MYNPLIYVCMYLQKQHSEKVGQCITDTGDSHVGRVIVGVMESAHTCAPTETLTHYRLAQHQTSESPSQVMSLQLFPWTHSTLSILSHCPLVPPERLWSGT